ncbi:MAG: hypothetical protein FWC33_03570 [Candidatus Bathyarchaeota archaeon]|nr:hypothetical protein [Candidatus Termiticorpusculum sp.]
MKVKCTVIVDMFTFEDGTYKKGDVFPCSSERAAKFSPLSITISPNPTVVVVNEVPTKEPTPTANKQTPEKPESATKHVTDQTN